MSELSLFLARALEMENAAGDRYRQLEQSMAANGNAELAALFARLGDFSRRHAGDVRRLAQGLGAVENLAAADGDWPGAEPPEVVADLPASAHTQEAIALALGGERSGWDYYRQTALCAPCPDTRRVAACLAEEEAEHVRTLERWQAWARRSARPPSDERP